MSLLPDATRIVVLCASTQLGVYVADTVLSSPLLPRVPVVIDAVGPAQPQHVASLHAVAAAHKGRATVVTTKGSVTLDATDVVVYAGDHIDVAAIAGLPRAPASEPPRLLLLTTGEGPSPALAAASSILKWNVVVAHCMFAGPPTAGTVTAEPSPNGDPGGVLDMLGPLEQLCLGTALGIARWLRVNASTPADVVPVDLLVHSAAAAMHLLGQHKIPPSPTSPTHFHMNVISRGGKGIVWGMVAEYVLDYMGRFDAELAKVMPVGVYQRNPSLAFNAHFPDLWNYGINMTLPVEMYRSRSAARKMSHLRNFPYSTSAERMKRAVKQVDAGLGAIASVSAQQRAELDGAAYETLLRRLSVSRETTAWLFASSLELVQWEQYVKAVCIATLRFGAHVVMQEHKPMKLPPPMPMYTNDVELRGAGRLPSPNLPMRRAFSDAFWALRAGQQHHGRLVPFRPGGGERKNAAILAQPHVQMLISNMSAEENVNKEEVEARALSILRGIGDTFNHQQARTMAYVMRKIFFTLYTSINVNPEGLERVHRALSRPKTAVVFIPSHRSYVDFLTLSYVVLAMGMAPPHICAGEDFLRLGKLSDFLRGSGAFFMRRSFKSDRLYGALFKEYIRHLVRDGQGLEFFIEGTRSRTGKTLPPKLGILKMVTDAFLEPQQEVNDVLFMPVSVSYEKLLEANVYANELLGIPKPKETPLNLLRSASVLKNRYGSYNLEFEEPISLADFIADPDACPTPYQRKARAPTPTSLPKGQAVMGGSYTPPALLQALGWAITDRLEKGIVVTPTALVAGVVLHMFDHAEVRDGVPIAAVASRIEWLRSNVHRRGGHLAKAYGGMDGVTLYREGQSHLDTHVQATALSRVYMSEEPSTPMLLSIYANQLLHLFGDEAIIAVAARAMALAGTATAATTPNGTTDGPVDDEAVNAGKAPGHPVVETTVAALGPVAHEVGQLLNVELPAFQPFSPVDPASWLGITLDRIASRGDATVGNGDLRLRTDGAAVFAGQLVYPFLESYYVVLLCFAALLADAPSPAALLAGTASGSDRAAQVKQTQLLHTAHLAAIRLHDERSILYAQSCNKETLTNGATRFLHRGVTRVEKTPAAVLQLTPEFRERGAAKLTALLRTVNGFRSRPSTDSDMAKAIAVVAEVHHGAHTKARL